METSYLKREFSCVQYPAVVKNVDKALKTLGGIQAISKVFAEENRRLELRFRPDDPFCKTAYSNIYDNKNILIKVVIKKKKKKGVVVKTEVTSEFLGIVSSTHKFETMMDYQYLPMLPVNNEAEPKDQLECISDQLVPNDLPSVDWLNLPAPQFFVPRFFSRMENPQNYAFRSNIAASVETSTNVSTDMILRTRKKRITHATYIAFSHNEPVPEKPKSFALGLLNATKKDYETIKNLFEVQPVWSKNSLLCHTKINSSSLKTILPCVAYYYSTGPWRRLWIKFGYDPRKDFNSRIYQLLDFRQKKIFFNIVTSREKIPRLTFNTKCKINSNKKKIIEKSEDNEYEDLTFFKPGAVPSFNNMHYQYCNIKVPEIEEMLEKLGDVHPGALCHEKRGWLPAGFDEQCREIMTSYLQEKMRELVAENKTQSQSGDLESTLDENMDDDMTIDDIEEGDDDVEDAPSEYEYEDVEDDGENVFQDA